jgi:hypothetical protein
MAFSSRIRLLPFVVLATVLVGLALASEARAQKGKAEDKKALELAKEKAKLEKAAALVALHYEEAKDLREAYLVLVATNHNYGKHVEQAGEHILKAVASLDKLVLAKGTAAQKDATKKENAAVAAATAAAAKAAEVNQPQADSDAKLALVSDALTKLDATLNANKQKGPKGHVEKAIKEIAAALKVN